MKRRGFLSLLGLAPAAPLIAKELAKEATPVPAVDVAQFSSKAVRYEPQRVSDCSPSYTIVCACTLGPTDSVPKKAYRMWHGWGDER